MSNTRRLPMSESRKPCCYEPEQRPIDSDPQELYKSECIGLGGIKHPTGPVFTPVVVNAGDRLWRDDDFVLVQDDDGALIVTVFGDVIGENF